MYVCMFSSFTTYSGTSNSFPAASSSSSSTATSSGRPTETSTGTSGGASSSGANADLQKKPLRVSGDWSEYVSSSGKRYYYNCKTEVSQWEKPKDWISPHVPPSESRGKDAHKNDTIRNGLK